MPEKPPRKSNFSQVIEEIERGRFAAAIDEKLMECAQHAEEIGGVSTLTVKLRIKRQQHAQMEIAATVESKLPQPKPQPSIFFLNGDTHQLERDDPRQKTMTLEMVRVEETTPAPQAQ